MQTAIHNVTNVTLKDINTFEKDEKSKTGTFYTRVLTVTNADGVEFELTLFTDDKSVLSF
jgi:hypothetical protein